MKRNYLLLALMVLLVLAQPVLARSSSKVSVENDSDWVIEEFYMSPTDDDDWGDDLLGDDILEPGDIFTLTNISCDDWDILIVDEDGDECILEEIDLCGDRAVWDITNRELLNCIEDTE